MAPRSRVVSNVPSNITMTVIAALINAGPAASRRHVTPPGFNAILSGVPAPSKRVAYMHLLRGNDRSYRSRARILCLRFVSRE